MAKKDIVVIGASAGGIEALSELVRCLPGDLAASVFVVVHISTGSTSVLPGILTRRGRLRAVHASDGARIDRSCIYVAPPSSHLILHGKRIRLVKGPREHGVIPAIDPLFRSAALAFGPRVTGVLLSGNLDDGTAGLELILAKGGRSIVQSPDQAQYAGMPRSAIESGVAMEVLPIVEIANRLMQIVSEAAEDGEMESDNEQHEDEQELAIDELVFDQLHSDDQRGVVSGLSCPECNGSLWEIAGPGTLRFRCRVGHAYGVDSLITKQQEALESAFWIALRALEERGALLRRLTRRAKRTGNKGSLQRYIEEAQTVTDRAKTIRDIIISGILSHVAETPTT